MESFLDQHQEEMLQFIEKLVSIDSGSYCKKGIDKIGKLLEMSYKQLGFNVIVDEQDEIW